MSYYYDVAVYYPNKDKTLVRGERVGSFNTLEKAERMVKQRLIERPENHYVILQEIDMEEKGDVGDLFKKVEEEALAKTRKEKAEGKW